MSGSQILINNVSQTGRRSALPFILLVMVLIVAAVVGYIFLTPAPDEKPKGTITPAAEITKPAEELTGNYDFDDGLRNPVSAESFEPDESDTGIVSVEVFAPDINGDKVADRITRIRYENGTPHFYYEYRIELAKDDGLIDITPAEFRTIEGADCALQKIRFLFIPNFRIIKISRQWQETWTTPTTARQTTYRLDGEKLNQHSSRILNKVCNVYALF
jgi:hypothetical protein